MSRIVKIEAREVLDSRGNPTIKVDTWTELGGHGAALVPSGASTGSREALELRDHDPKRFKGKGVLKAINNVNNRIAKLVIGMEVTSQVAIDKAMIKLDGSENKRNLGANAILGVSLAVAKAAADELDLPLYRYLGGTSAKILPLPMCNIINGGEHANNTIDFQEFLIMPVGAKTMREAVRMASEVFHTLKGILSSKGEITSVGDEGGFAPNLTIETAIETITQAIKKAGYTAGHKGVMIAIDSASSELFVSGKYSFKGEAKAKNKKEVIRTTDQMVTYLDDLIKKYPHIISLEDGLAEGDWDGFVKHVKKSGDKIQIIGDDIFVTNPKITAEGIRRKASNSVLIKLNQIGTLTETIETIQMAQKAGWTTVVSHRSGETEDTTIADLAVGLSCEQIKTGSLSRTDRISKYNRLMEIEDELGVAAEFHGIKSIYNLKREFK